MNSLKGSGGEHMKFLTFGTPLNKMKHPNKFLNNRIFAQLLSRKKHLLLPQFLLQKLQLEVQMRKHNNDYVFLCMFHFRERQLDFLRTIYV